MKTLVVPAVLESLAALRQFAREAAAGAGIDEGRAYELQLAVDEIATNIINYGYRDRQPSAEISIHGEASDSGLLITLEDAAPAFDPRGGALLPDADSLAMPLEEREVGGLGIYLAVNGVDRFEYRYENGHNFNIFEVYKKPVTGG